MCSQTRCPFISITILITFVNNMYAATDDNGEVCMRYLHVIIRRTTCQTEYIDNTKKQKKKKKKKIRASLNFYMSEQSYTEGTGNPALCRFYPFNHPFILYVFCMHTHMYMYMYVCVCECTLGMYRHTKFCHFQFCLFQWLVMYIHHN